MSGRLGWWFCVFLYFLFDLLSFYFANCDNLTLANHALCWKPVVLLLCFLGFWHWRAFWSRLNRRAQSCEVQRYNHSNCPGGIQENFLNRTTHSFLGKTLEIICSLLNIEKLCRMKAKNVSWFAISLAVSWFVKQFHLKTFAPHSTPPLQNKLVLLRN